MKDTDEQGYCLESPQAKSSENYKEELDICTHFTFNSTTV
jgi:hypothetical protein